MIFLAKLGAPVWALSISFPGHPICFYSRNSWFLSLDREGTPLEEIYLA